MTINIMTFTVIILNMLLSHRSSYHHPMIVVVVVAAAAAAVAAAAAAAAAAVSAAAAACYFNIACVFCVSSTTSQILYCDSLYLIGGRAAVQLCSCDILTLPILKNS
ncbi:hypothetical protein PoB_006040400 [Plakobranchus ocellatus]|uniref:Secreted protein n=1 Tax=Plakobranchus ocellatus TaxID=259542 RepID=A0AAV4CPV3_9GAST|nr:hypothetical protein PoB_006040400 [Plakobranchus ocellatus]